MPPDFRGPLMTVFYCTFMPCPLLYEKQIWHLFSAFLLVTLPTERTKYYNFIACVNKNCGIYGSKILFKDLFQEKRSDNQGKATCNVSALLTEYPKRVFESRTFRITWIENLPFRDQFS